MDPLSVETSSGEESGIILCANDKSVCDVVHGQISVHPLCFKIIDTLEFQRLRNISQCGMCSFVYPTANHTRFTHSIGVYHLVDKFVQQLELNIKKLGPKAPEITEPEKLCLKIAGLCHDLGHGPFSHSWELYLNQHHNKIFKHEEASCKIFDLLVKNNQLMVEFNKYDLGEEHVELIKNIIEGKASNYKGKEFLFQIVANEKTKIDVDKLDYMKRDGMMFGTSFNVNYQRILANLAFFINDRNGQVDIAFHEKVAESIRDIYDYRAKMHKYCYRHRKAVGIEIMLFDALAAADEHLKIEVDGTKYKLSECHENIQSLLKISDYIFYSILNSDCKNLEESRNILKRILRRKIYFMVGNEEITNIEIKDKPNDVNSKLQIYMKERFPDHKFIVQLIDIDTGASGCFEKIHFFDVKNKKRKWSDVMGTSNKPLSLFVQKRIYCVCTTENLENSLKEDLCSYFTAVIQEWKRKTK